MIDVERSKDGLKEFQLDKNTWIDRIGSLEEMVSNLQRGLDHEERENVRALINTIEEKDTEISKQSERIELLSNDLQNIAIMHDDDVMDSLIATERSMRAMVSSLQIALQKQLAGQANGLKSLLTTRRIPLEDEAPFEDSHEQEEKISQPEDIMVMDTNEAADAVMAAAVSALQKPPVVC
jgi:hypothetical protein